MGDWPPRPLRAPRAAQRFTVALVAVLLAVFVLGFLAWSLTTRNPGQLAWLTSIATVLAIVLTGLGMSVAMLTWVTRHGSPQSDLQARDAAGVTDPSPPISGQVHERQLAADGQTANIRPRRSVVFGPDAEWAESRHAPARIGESAHPPGHVFISYAREDSAGADQLQRVLEAAGLRVWRDTSNLWPGEDWRAKIRQAIQGDALVFIACFSQRSLTRTESYQNEELTLAIDQLRLRPLDEPWLIPVRFDDCDIPDRDIGASRTLSSLQRADLFGDQLRETYARLVTAVLRIQGRPARAPVSAARPQDEERTDSLARQTGAGHITWKGAPGTSHQPQDEVRDSWDAMTATERQNALSRLLAPRDVAAADTLRALPDSVMPDLAALLSTRLADGETSTAAWCLAALHSPPFEWAEGRLLGDLLAPDRETQGADWRRYTSALARVLQQRPVPEPGTFRYSCDNLRYGEAVGWQARLVLRLLLSETAGTDRMARAAGWVEWLCGSEFTGDWEQPQWIMALSATRSLRLTRKNVDAVRLLVRQNHEWATLVLRLAHYTQRLPQMIEALDQDLVDMAVRIGTVGNDVESDGLADLRGALDVPLWKQQVPPSHIASIDVVRVLLGGDPVDLPSKASNGYSSRLLSILRHAEFGPFRVRIEGHFLAFALRDDSVSASAFWLVTAFSDDPELRTGLFEFQAALSAGTFPDSDRLNRPLMEVITLGSSLRAYTVVPRLRSAAADAARNPEVALQRRADKIGVNGTQLALAIYESGRAGLRVDEIVSVLHGAGINQIAFQSLDNVLREVQSLEAYTSNISGEGPESAPGEDLFEYYRLIADGALGVEYGRQFKEYLTARLQSEMYSRKQIRRALSRGPSLWSRLSPHLR